MPPESWEMGGWILLLYVETNSLYFKMVQNLNCPISPVIWVWLHHIHLLQ